MGVRKTLRHRVRNVHWELERFRHKVRNVRWELVKDSDTEIELRWELRKTLRYYIEKEVAF